MPRATAAVVAPRVSRSLRSLCLLPPARVLPVDRSTRAGRPQEASCSTGAKAAVSASSAMHGGELMARAPEHCDQADIMPLVDSPAVQTREPDMLMHNETLRTAVGAASTPVRERAIHEDDARQLDDLRYVSSSPRTSLDDVVAARELVHDHREHLRTQRHRRRRRRGHQREQHRRLSLAAHLRSHGRYSSQPPPPTGDLVASSGKAGRRVPMVQTRGPQLTYTLWPHGAAPTSSTS